MPLPLLTMFHYRECDRLRPIKNIFLNFEKLIQDAYDKYKEQEPVV